MKKFTWALLPALFFLLTAALPVTSGPQAWTIVTQMFDTAKEVKQMSYVMTRKERYEGKITEAQNLIKVQVSPYKAYLKRLGEDGGVEVLYVDGKNGNKILVNPNGFPWVNVSLSPNSSRVRKGNHHTIMDNGYRRMIGYLENQLTRFHDRFDQIASVEDNASFNGIPCWKVRLSNPDFHIKTHTAKAGETVQSVADKHLVNAYRIIELNSHIEEYDDLKAGMVFKIPSHYCKSAIIHISKTTRLPQGIEIHDELGFYEAYSYEQVNINPGFTDIDFSSNNPKYNF